MNPRFVFAPLLAAGALAVPCAAQPCPTFQPATYTASPTTPSFSSIAGSPGAVQVFGPGVDDTTTASAPLPGPFNYWGQPKTSYQVNNNGFVVFNQSLGTGFFTNAAPGSAASPNDAVLPWWDDLHTGPAAGGVGSVWTSVLPGGGLAVEWNSMEQFPGGLSGENVTIQLVLNLAPANTIEFHYDASTFSSGPITWSATIGLEDSSAANSLDVTGLGALNAAFPATDFTLTPMPSGPPQVVPTYNVSMLPPSFSSIAASPGATLVFGPGIDDTTSASAPLPSPFSFWAQPKTAYQVNNNGFIAFDQSLGGGFFTNAAPGSSASPNDIAMPFWDDLHTGPAAGGVGSVWTSVLPGGGLAVEWNMMERFPGDLSGESVTFQAVLNPAPASTIEFRYDPATFSSGPIVWSASIGVENATGMQGLDVTGLGATNAAFPATDVLLTPCSACGVAIPYGVPCPSTIGTSGGAPVAGNLAFAITQTGATPGVPTFLVLGLSNSTWVVPPAVPLPLPFAVFGVAGGCSLLASADILLPGATTAAGTSSFALPVPPGLMPCAATLYAQWVNLSAVAPVTLTATNGLQIVTG